MTAKRGDFYQRGGTWWVWLTMWAHHMVSEDRPNPHEGGEKEKKTFCLFVVLLFLSSSVMQNEISTSHWSVLRVSSPPRWPRMEEKTNGLSVDEIHARGRLFSRLFFGEPGSHRLKGRKKKKVLIRICYSLYAMPPPQRHMARARKNIRGAPSYIRRQVSQKIAFPPLPFFP